MSDYPMLISNKLHSFRNFAEQIYNKNGTTPRNNEHIVDGMRRFDQQRDSQTDCHT